MKLEVGKSYKTRGGWKATAYSKSNWNGNMEVRHEHPDDGGVYMWHYPDGILNSSQYPDYDLIAEWEDEVDLTKIEKPFGLLDKETQERLKAHGGPYQNYGFGWGDCKPVWLSGIAYRVKPKPTVEYKKTGFVNSKHTGFSYEITEKFVDGKYDSYTVDMVPF